MLWRKEITATDARSPEVLRGLRRSTQSRLGISMGFWEEVRAGVGYVPELFPGCQDIPRP